MLSVLITASAIRLKTGGFCHKTKDDFSSFIFFGFSGKSLDPCGG
jgi:hypothetical protein